MAALDWVFVVILLGSVLIGAWRGLVFEVLSLISWVLAFLRRACGAPRWACGCQCRMSTRACAAAQAL